jgi:hypothetical protein
VKKPKLWLGVSLTAYTLAMIALVWMRLRGH